jgi:hypothetical protein
LVGRSSRLFNAKARRCAKFAEGGPMEGRRKKGTLIGADLR